MNDLSKAAQQALEVLGGWSIGRDMDAVALNDLIATLETALAQQEQAEPDWDEIRCGGPGCDLMCCQPVQKFPDCRLCKRYAGWMKPCRTTMPCIEGDQFIKDYPVRMWKGAK